MTATYLKNGRGRSIRATAAENEGRLPLTRAIKFVADFSGITAKQSRALLRAIGPCEAHHTGGYARLTDYYDTQEATKAADHFRLHRRLPETWKEKISVAMRPAEGRGEVPFGERVVARDAACAELAAMADVSADDVRDAYYHLKDEMIEAMSGTI